MAPSIRRRRRRSSGLSSSDVPSVAAMLGVSREDVRMPQSSHSGEAVSAVETESHKLKNDRKDLEERVRNACLLAAPTGCASFQLKFGASTLHRIFGIPVGPCGPWNNRDGARFWKMKTRLLQAKMFVVDEMSMVGRQMLGKIEFKIQDTLRGAEKRGGSGRHDT